jgi:hypothetical protein
MGSGRFVVTAHEQEELTMAESTSCAFDACKCDLSAESIVRQAGKAYCSQRCADGRGCDHADCNCGDYPKAEPKA